MVELVSVIIPTFSRADSINRAIESVFQQTWNNIEIIVVDDNGINTDNQIKTERRIQSYIENGSIYYIKHVSNLNGAAARNTGVKYCHGEYVTFLDDDDELCPTKIEESVVHLKKANANVGAIYSGYTVKNGKKIVKIDHPTKNGNLQLDLLLMKWGFGTGSNPVFKRIVFDKVGLFDETFERHQDWEFMIRFFRNYTIISIEKSLLIRHNDNGINIPNCIKYEIIKWKFLYKFKDDIEKYNMGIQKCIFRNQLSDVGFHMILAKQYKLACKAYLRANKYKSLSFRIIFRGLYYAFFNYKTM